MRAISIFLACWSSIVWFRTFLLLPVKTIPRDLPENYDLRRETPCAKIRKKSAKYEETVNLKSNRDDEFDEKVEQKPVLETDEPTFLDVIKSSQFIWLAFWYCLVSLRVNSFQFWFNPTLQWLFPDQKKIHSQLTNIFGVTYIMSLPLSPVAGMAVDYFAARLKNQAIRKKLIISGRKITCKNLIFSIKRCYIQIEKLVE